MGLPVAATDAPGPASIITHEQNGLLVPSGDAQALANALAYLIEDAHSASRMASAGFERAGI